MVDWDEQIQAHLFWIWGEEEGFMKHGKQGMLVITDRRLAFITKTEMTWRMHDTHSTRQFNRFKAGDGTRICKPPPAGCGRTGRDGSRPRSSCASEGRQFAYDAPSLARKTMAASEIYSAWRCGGERRRAEAPPACSRSRSSAATWTALVMLRGM